MVTNINSFNSEGSSVFGYRTFIDSVRIAHHGFDGFEIQTGEDEEELTLSTVNISSLENASEQLTAWGIQTPVGISILLQEGFSSRLHLDVSLVPEVRFGLNGKIEGQIIGNQIPIDDSFPGIDNFNQNANSITTQDYIIQEEIKESISSNDPRFCNGINDKP